VPVPNYLQDIGSEYTVEQAVNKLCFDNAKDFVVKNYPV